MPGLPAGSFAFEYSGDFMSPSIRDGDIVIVQPGNAPTTGDIVLIVGKWGEAYLRRYRIRGDDIYYSADNASYAPFKSDSNISILGTVHTVWRKIKT
jgi:SOS-response transcriptional repressor LexA